MELIVGQTFSVNNNPFLNKEDGCNHILHLTEVDDKTVSYQYKKENSNVLCTCHTGAMGSGFFHRGIVDFLDHIERKTIIYIKSLEKDYRNKSRISILLE